MSYTYKYPRAALTVDCVVFGFDEGELKNVFLEQLYTFGEMERDPRERVVSVGHYALVKLSEHEAKAATDAANARWFAVSKVPKLAFDHAEILATALARLKA